MHMVEDFEPPLMEWSLHFIGGGSVTWNHFLSIGVTILDCLV